MFIRDENKLAEPCLCKPREGTLFALSDLLIGLRREPNQRIPCGLAINDRQRKKSGEIVYGIGAYHKFKTLFLGLSGLAHSAHGRILVVDPGLDPLTDEEILDFFDLSQVPVEVEALDLRCFENAVTRLLE